VIIIGLGNPGSKYEKTRHNAGFLIAEAACVKWRSGGWVSRPLFNENELRLAGSNHRVICPTTYMNCSGDAVEKLLAQGARPEDLVVVFDDVDLPFGRVRIRKRGGAGGHNGLQSILDVVETANVIRMRIGVGRPDATASMTDHVLGELSGDDVERFAMVVDRALSALHMILRQGPEFAMNRINNLPEPWREEEPEKDTDSKSKTVSDKGNGEGGDKRDVPEDGA
jgi:peptidyl-tRNA hydrolase, PTH1 family